MGKKQTPDEFTGAWRTGEKKKMKKDAKVLTVQDISCFGQCSLTVALPVISAAGIECAILPSAVLSTHTGGFKGFTFRDLTDDIPGIVSHWEKEGITFDAIYTGYLGSIRQIDLVKDLMDRVLAPGGLRIVDPAMADNGVLYYGFDAGFAAAMAGLCATADVVLPNITEAALMTGLPYRAAGYDEAYITSLCRALTERGAGTVVLTGVSYEEEKLGVAVFAKGDEKPAYYMHEKLPKNSHGTGDIFAAAFTGALLRGRTPLSAAGVAAEFTLLGMKATAGDEAHWYGTKFEKALPYLVAKLNRG